MALTVPNLDDRRFQDLVDDAKRLVQRRCPEWTDHNVSDPGVTLIEAFAHMTDQLLYRLNLVPDRLYVKFLDLIGLTLLPPTPATAPVTFWLTAPSATTLTIPRATRIATMRSHNQEAIEFSTVADLPIPPHSLRFARTSVRPDPESSAETADRTVALSLNQSFPAFNDPPRAGDVLLIGLDDPAPRCAIRLDIKANIDGIGVDPAHAPLIWEAWHGSGWSACDISMDTTNGLNTSGSVIAHIPTEHEASIIDGVRAGWLQARILDPESGQAGYRQSPILHGLTACTVGGTIEAMHAEMIEHETVGEAEGVPGQIFTLSRRPVLAGNTRPILETSSEDGWCEWVAVEHFADSTPTDRHYVLDAVTGTVAFGPAIRESDGTLRCHGATPARGAAVRIRRYSVGGGRPGNVSVAAISTLKSSIPFVASVENRRAARGGVDGETLEEAKSRAPLVLRTRSRAVTADDYEALARQGAPDVARIRCLTAGEAGTEAGTVRLLVVPAASGAENKVAFEDLVPQQASLERIAHHLDRYRVIGTVVNVEPPLYRGVTVVARLIARTKADCARVRVRAEQALYAFINPLPGGGPDGAGWPFGRPVQSGDIYSLLQRVDGVELVASVRLFPADPVTGRRGRDSNHIDLDANSLVFSYHHQLRVEAP